MVAAFPFTSIVLVLGLIVYLWMSFKVGGARGKYNVQAPATDGPPEFLRIYRAHMNTLEQLVVFVPGLVLFASAWGDMIAAIIGVFWPIGRVLYAQAYYQAAEKHGPGFGISFLSSAILLVGGLIGAIMAIVK